MRRATSSARKKQDPVTHTMLHDGNRFVCSSLVSQKRVTALPPQKMRSILAELRPAFQPVKFTPTEGGVELKKEYRVYYGRYFSDETARFQAMDEAGRGHHSDETARVQTMEDAGRTRAGYLSERGIAHLQVTLAREALLRRLAESRRRR